MKRSGLWLVAAVLSTACTSGLFTGGAKKERNKSDDPKKTDAPAQGPGSVEDPYKKTGGPAEQQSSHPNDIPAVTPAARAGEGNLLVPVTALSNMASGNQIASNDNFALLTADGQVVGAGQMSLDAVTNGTVTETEGSSQRTLVLNVALQKIGNASGDGQERRGHLKIGRVDDVEAALSDPKNARWMAVNNLHEGSLPNHYDYDVRYAQDGKTIKILSVEGYRLDEGSSKAPLVATVHAMNAHLIPECARKDFQSPLVLDLNGNGVADLLNVFDDRHQIRFDVEGKGELARVGWVAPADGLLVFDKNRSGLIENGRELFGTATASDGFAALALFDRNDDGKIDAQDPVFKLLRVWQDLNSNGVTDKGELKTLSQHGVTAISLAYQRVAPNDPRFSAADNEVRLASTAKAKAGEVAVYDVWFKVRRLTDVVNYDKADAFH